MPFSREVKFSKTGKVESVPASGRKKASYELSHGAQRAHLCNMLGRRNFVYETI